MFRLKYYKNMNIFGARYKSTDVKNLQKQIQECKTEIKKLKELVNYNHNQMYVEFTALDEQIMACDRYISNYHQEFEKFKKITLVHEDDMIKILDMLKHVIHERNNLKKN